MGHCRKWAAVKSLKDKSARSVSVAFEHHMLASSLLAPYKDMTGNGVEFRSSKFQELFKKKPKVSYYYLFIKYKQNEKEGNSFYIFMRRYNSYPKIQLQYIDSTSRKQLSFTKGNST